MFTKSIVIFMLIYVRVSSSTSAGSYVIFRFSIFLVSVKYTLFCSEFMRSIRTGVKIRIFPIPIAHRSGVGISSKSGRIPTTSGWLDSLLYPYTKMSSTV